jgi:4'-phosphopantetheinyl transferase EntD
LCARTAIETVLPTRVAAAETAADVPESELYAAERELVEQASPRRRAEFAAVRRCARRAMAERGLAAAPLLPGDRDAPGWPAGVVGSMTHCAGYRAAAVALSSEIAALGIDAEPHAALPAGVRGRIAAPAEQDHLASLPSATGEVHWGRVFFAAKEAVYKAWFPLARRPLGFADAELRIDPAAGRFTARILAPEPPVGEIAGRFAIRDGLVLTAVAVPARVVCGQAPSGIRFPRSSEHGRAGA